MKFLIGMIIIQLFLLNSLEPGIKMKISENLFFLIKQSIYFHEITNGYFDITTASLMPDADKEIENVWELII